MPIYEYECKKCGHRFEKIQQYSDELLTKCPKCKGKLEQVITAPSVHFKGSGWYVTDYAKKGSAGGSSSKSESSDSAKSVDASSDSSKTETKSESKAESKSESKPHKKK